ncbi:MAG: radical SAM/SPASM domain-containing protein [Magnetococcales bacterium]|nr:radical SAM/SPASM domain-containing protein [Magnetococcales bacterium]
MTTPAVQMDWTKLEQVEIQIASWCNRSCHFCPSGTFPTPKEGMTLEMVERIMVQLESVSFAGTIGLHLMCEPLMHKKILEIVQQFRTRLPRAFIRMESNGDALKNIERLGWLFDHGLNEILINCYDSPEQFQRLNRGVLGLRPASGPIWYWNLWRHNPTLPKPQWRVVRVRAFFGTGFSLKNWAGHVEHQRPDPVALPLKLGCDRPFARMHINYLGQVLLCNMDWKYEVVVGDLRIQTMAEVWNAPLLQEYRSHLLVKDREMALCRLCDSGAPAPVQPGYPPADPWVFWRSRWLTWTRWLQRMLGRPAR